MKKNPGKPADSGALRRGTAVRTRRRQARDPARETDAERALRERMKELQALYRLSELTSMQGLTQAELFQAVAEFLPESWQYPEIACARIALDGREFRSKNFGESAWRQSAPIKVGGAAIGAVEVYYLEQRPDCGEGPFLKEERALVNAIAERLGHIAARTRSEEALRESEEYNKTLFADSFNALGVIDPERACFTDCNEAARMLYGLPSRAAMLGLTPLDLSPPLQYDGTDSATCMRRQIEAGMNRASHMFEWRHLRPGGVVWDAEVHLMAFRHRGRMLLQFNVRDVTRLRQAHQALRESERKYRLLSENASECIFWTGTDGHFKYLSPSCEKLFGWAPEEFLADPGLMSRLVHPDDRAEYHGHVHRASKVAGAADLELRILRRDGELRWIRHICKPLRDEAGRYLGRRGSNSDITERKVFEQKLLNSRNLLRQFLDRFPGTAYLKDAQSRVLLANMGFKTLHGLDPVAMVGRRSDEVFGGEFGRKIVADDRRIIEAGQTEIIEEAFGGRYFESIKFVITQDEERLLGGITVDVTPRVRSRLRVEALMALTERGGVLEEREFLRFGLEKAEQITSSAIGFLHFVNEDQESIELGVWTEGALKGCEAVYDKHYPISGAGIWADCFRRRGAAIFNDYEGYAAKRGLPPGHAKLARLISVPVLDEGKVRMMLGVGNKASDYDEFDVQSLQLIGNDLWRIVRRARAEQALKDRLEEITALNRKFEQSQDQLLQSEKMATIGQLAAGVAHELNNPIGFVQSNLGTLSGYVSDLLEIVAHSEQCAQRCAVPGHLDSLRRIMEQKDFDFLKDDVRQLLAESKDGADRVRRIVQNLKDFSHVSEDEWQWADLHKGLESTLTLVWNEIKYKAEVEKSYGELPEVFCVASQLNQVFMNLLVNAAQAIETRGKISIATGVLAGAPEEEAKVWIEIRDTGKGIAQENLKRIFDPFFTTKPVGKGTGLGLSLAWSIVQKHRGSIEARSAIGEGTTFRLELPVNARQDTQKATP